MPTGSSAWRDAEGNEVAFCLALQTREHVGTVRELAAALGPMSSSILRYAAEHRGGVDR